MKSSCSLTGAQAAVLILTQSVSGQTSDELIASSIRKTGDGSGKSFAFWNAVDCSSAKRRKTIPSSSPAPGIPPGTEE